VRDDAPLIFIRFFDPSALGKNEWSWNELISPQLLCIVKKYAYMDIMMTSILYIDIIYI
jgi:hypothetical protein